ncbi:MAG: hypothetical protein IBJ18_04530 [Phycisphaerales bacterium]|nr:hypothetical protein [Phycisphaerales bacterium]
MRWFALSSVMFFGMIALAAWWFSREQHEYWTPISGAVVGVSLWPWAVVVLTATAVHAFSPRRVLDHRVRARFPAFGLGLVLSVLACICTLPALTVFDLLWPQKQAWNVEPGTAAEWINSHRSTLLWCVVAIACSLPTAVAISLFTRRVRPGCCPACGYNLSTITPAARGLCPECGHDQFALSGEPAPRSLRPISP